MPCCAVLGMFPDITTAEERYEHIQEQYHQAGRQAGSRMEDVSQGRSAGTLVGGFPKEYATTSIIVMLQLDSAITFGRLSNPVKYL
jgi:hypothetical protein